MAQHALDHGGDLGGRAALELGIDVCRASFDMPVDHDAPSTITRMPFRHQVAIPGRSEEHTSELQSLMRISYAVFCLKKKKEKFKNYLTITKQTELNKLTKQC